MNYLLYCVLASAPAGSTVRLPESGIDGRPLRVVNAAGLSAVVSTENQVAIPVTVQAAMAYGEVVEALHENHTLIPMRYGCCFENRLAVQRHLRKCGPAYKALLAELDGQVEMSIRIVLPEFREHDRGEETALPGLAYLQSRRRHYEVAQWQQQSLEEITGVLCGQLKGLFRRSKAETTKLGGRQTPCLHFLIAKQSVADFRDVFHRLAPLETHNHLLLNGPWPPYNFVVEESAATQEEAMANLLVQNL